MTVGELISALQNFDKDIVILGRGYEDGYDDIEPSLVKLVCEKEGSWYNGKYDEYEPNSSYNWVGKPFRAITL